MIKAIGQQEDCCKSCYGGKGYNLNQLKQAGFLVPEGYIITTEEFDDFMKHNKINYTTDEYLAFNAEIQESIIHGNLPEKLTSELSSLINQMKNNGIKKFVVRSSAICEDSETFSMAGMFESYINLSSISNIEEALKKCYASLYSDRILDFMFDNEISFDNLKMAVVLQEYISGEISGVTFLMQDVLNIETTSLSKGASRTVFRLDTYGEDQIVNGFYYIMTKELDNKDARRKSFVDEVNNLFDDGKNIYVY